MTPPEIVSTVFTLGGGVIGFSAQLIAWIMGYGIAELNCNFFLKLLALLGFGLLYFILGAVIYWILFSATSIAYEKDLKNKKTIFLINLILFWTLIVPVILRFYVNFCEKKNKFIDD